MTILDWLFGGLAVVAGAVAALAGFGIGSLLTPALSVAVGTKIAVALVAVPHIVATAARLWVLRASVDRRVLLGFGLASAAGGLAGALLHTVLAGPLLGKVLGGLLILAGTSELTGLGRRFRLSGVGATLAGALSGVFGGLVGNQGGVRSAALMRFELSREALVATATATALLVDVARLPVYVATSGADMLREWPTLVLLTAGVLVGTYLGAPILRRVPETVFRRLLAMLLIILGAWLVIGPAT
jgi:uncharacterized membrane protein YfcA